MELTWWPVAIAGLLCLTICIALAMVLPTPQPHRRLRPLAHVDRLTRLPEYSRFVRLQFWSMLMFVVLLVTVFTLAVLASSRPAALGSVDAAHQEDIMVCVGDPVTDAATASLLNYFARQTVGFDTQRIGLTSSSLRVVPLTRDYQYAADEFSRYAELAALQQNLDADKPLSEAQHNELRTGVEDFSRPLDYVDYARSTADVLALCMAGFPNIENDPARRRSVIYLGPNETRRPDEQRPALFSAQQVKDIAVGAGIEVNTITPANDADLDAIAAGTGGRVETYDSGAAELDASVDRIRAAASVAGAGRKTIARPVDSPKVPLIGGIVVSALLCIALAVQRR
ncbi:MAG: hypothetical protein JO044_01210 [Mycobacteriaceae bacterium]|nr:hypothetical protein [Mycobacteriaceae bacterium]MBV9638407.1 hypothetical protein [Mycobacteriaceae bacterium]